MLISFQMTASFDNPFSIFAISLVAQIVGAFAGDLIRRHAASFKQGERHDFSIVQAATLTLLALIIGFSFSMAVSRYDQRKTLEEAEANAIGTEYLRVDLLPGDDASRARELLNKYLDLRVAFYEESDAVRVAEIGQQTARVQSELWSAVLPGAVRQPSPVMALVVSGMNDVINSQGYTQASWWNRIPIGAWAMMALMALSCNVLIGYSERRKGQTLLFILPFVISVAFFLIADLDSPRGGAIRVHPQNLLAAAQSMKP
ncbi:protein-S-isoprenylcysteine O-methyltransferase Ste14 [Bradyrhizobium sp. USDA 4448]